MQQEQYNLLDACVNSLQAAVSSLQMVVRELNPARNSEIITDKSDLISKTISPLFPLDGSWYDKIRATISRVGKPLSAREIMVAMSPLVGESVEGIRDRVNTNCSTMRHDGLIAFLPNYPGSKRGKYLLPEWVVQYPGSELSQGKAGIAKRGADSLDEFREWLPANNVSAGVDAYTSRLRMLEAREGRSIDTLLTDDGLERVLDRINPAAFGDLSSGTLSDMRTAVRKYNEFRLSNEE